MPAAVIDVTGEVCPMTWVRVKLALEALPDGAELEVLLQGSMPVRNVPRSAAEDGHEVLSLEALPAGPHRLRLRARHGG